MVVSASIGHFYNCFTQSVCLADLPPGMGSIIATTLGYADNIHHLMAIIHSFPESPFRLSTDTDGCER